MYSSFINMLIGNKNAEQNRNDGDSYVPVLQKKTHLIQIIDQWICIVATLMQLDFSGIMKTCGLFNSENISEFSVEL